MKRAFWLSTGMVVGAASSVSAMLRVRRRLSRLAPSQIVGDLRARLGDVGRELQLAAQEGRMAMAEREAQLWAEIDPERDRRRRPALSDASVGSPARGPSPGGRARSALTPGSRPAARRRSRRA
ncbi:MAG: hypothetical protein ACT4OS_08690 [Acidimicrobiales bacterium]